MAAAAFPPVFDFVLPAGDSLTLELTVKNADLSVKDITGMTIKWSAQKHHQSATRVDLTTTGGDITIIDGPNGRCDVVIAKATITTVGLWKYELEIIDQTTGSQTVLKGNMNVTKTFNPTT